MGFLITWGFEYMGCLIYGFPLFCLVLTSARIEKVTFIDACFLPVCVNIYIYICIHPGR